MVLENFVQARSFQRITTLLLVTEPKALNLRNYYERAQSESRIRGYQVPSFRDKSIIHSVWPQSQSPIEFLNNPHYASVFFTERSENTKTSVNPYFKYLCNKFCRQEKCLIFMQSCFPICHKCFVNKINLIKKKSHKSK